MSTYRPNATLLPRAVCLIVRHAHFRRNGRTLGLTGALRRVNGLMCQTGLFKPCFTVVTATTQAIRIDGDQPNPLPCGRDGLSWPPTLSDSDRYLFPVLIMQLTNAVHSLDR